MGDRIDKREMGAFQDSIAQRLSSARLRRGWSREALAFHSGVSWSAIAQIEHGRRQNLRPGTASALARALGVTIDFLLTGRSPPAPTLDHRALLYATDAELLEVAVPYLTGAVERSEATMAATSAANIAALRDGLGAVAQHIEFVENTRWYTTPASALLGYSAYVQASVDAGAPWVCILGEPVWLGRSAAESRAWARYESLLNVVFATAPATILCPYDVHAVDDGTVANANATHPHTHPPKPAAGSAGAGAGAYVEPGEFLTR
jgi:transcriptional regulator with XRE-family HTH domain